MTTNFKYVQAQVFQLAGAGVAEGDNSMTLESFNQIDGTALTMSNFGIVGYGTLEPGSGINEEQISFTGVVSNVDGTVTLTGISTVLDVYPYTQTANFASGHAGGVGFVISNTAGFYGTFANKQNDESITGKWTFLVTQRPTLTADLDTSTPSDLVTFGQLERVAILGSVPATAVLPGIAMVANSTDIATGNDTRNYLGNPYSVFVLPSQLQSTVSIGYFGNGSDGDVTISAPTTLTRDMFYNNLTVNAGNTLSPASFRIFVKGILTVNGAISFSGANGGDGGNGQTLTSDGVATPGAAGAAAAGVPDAFLKGSIAGKAGGVGGTGASSAGAAGIAGTTTTYSFFTGSGGAGGAGGAGHTGGGAGLLAGGALGAGGTTTQISSPSIQTVLVYPFLGATIIGAYPGSGSGGGGGGGNFGASPCTFGSGGGGGGSGATGGEIYIAAATIIIGATGTISSNGGTGGRGGHGSNTSGGSQFGQGAGGGGGGGAGGGGGLITLVYTILTNSGSLTVAGGVGGTAGAGGIAEGGLTDGVAGSIGANGLTGVVTQIIV